MFIFLPADGFGKDERAGHGTHVAGSAAGATLHTPAETVACEDSKALGCVGGCINGSSIGTDDDLITTAWAEVDIDRLCPEFGCDATTNELCLSNDVGQTLTDHGGAAPGAKLAIFDVFYEDYGFSSYVGNDIWEACEEAGCKLHSMSSGSDYECELGPVDIEYDQFMYEVRRRLIVRSSRR